MTHAEQVSPLIVWFILATVLVLVASGRFRFDLVAISGLMSVGVLRIAPPAVLLSGFGSPALFAVASILLIGEAINESRLFSGLGHALEQILHKQDNQVMGLSLTTSMLSAFMNNVGVLSLTLPVATNMARRARTPAGTYTMPLAYAAILGGSMTLVGSAPNVIVSAYRAEALGRPFGMFDFAPHGVAIVTAGALLWLTCRLCGFSPGREQLLSPALEDIESEDTPDRFPRDLLSTRRKQLTLFTVIPTLVLVSLGILSPAVAFGSAAAILVASGVIGPGAAYRRIDFSVIVFLGAMLGMARILEETGAVALLTDHIVPITATMSPFMLVTTVFLLSSLLGSILNNAAAAAIMAPIALDLSRALPADSLLMAVAAGSCLSMSLPTHQATIMAMSRGWFSPARFARTGAFLTLVCAIVAAAVILLVWGNG